MLLSIALIFLVGTSLGAIFKKLNLPSLVGLLITGIVIGPYVLNLISPGIINVSADLREIALIIILVKAGLSLNIEDLKKVGRPAILMSFVPATCEIVGIFLLAPIFLGVTHTEALLIGSVIAAVSPAVVVNKMVSIMDSGYGKKKGIPQLILTGASMDDIFVIVLFTTFLGIEQGHHLSALSFAQIPISILSGFAVGILSGVLITLLFKKLHIRDSSKIIIILGVACLLVTLENLLKGTISFASLLAIMSMAVILKNKRGQVADRLASKFSKIWVVAEIILFVLVGAQVNIHYAFNAGIMVVVLVLCALMFRCCGVFICLIKTNFNFKERLFCALSYFPKATVQAAIGGVPLAIGLACGQLVLSIAVVSIIITAPLGAILIDKTYKKLLTKD